MRFFSVLTILIFIIINFKSVNSSVLNSANTMTCLEFYTSNDLMDKAGQSSFFAKEILYVQYIFDKDVPIYNYTGDFGYEEDIKCLDGKCSIHQKVDDALLLLTTFKEAGQEYGKHFYSVSSIDFNTYFERLNAFGIMQHDGKMVCEEPLPKFYLIDEN